MFSAFAQRCFGFGNNLYHLILLDKFYHSTLYRKDVTRRISSVNKMNQGGGGVLERMDFYIFTNHPFMDML